MKAEELRKIAKEIVQPEIDRINKQLFDEATLGRTQTTINEVSQGAVAYLKDEGYEIKTIMYGTFYAQVIIIW
jgi:hypothetical protein